MEQAESTVHGSQGEQRISCKHSWRHEIYRTLRESKLLAGKASTTTTSHNSSGAHALSTSLSEL
jgi:hypothetical protein